MCPRPLEQTTEGQVQGQQSSSHNPSLGLKKKTHLTRRCVAVLLLQLSNMSHKISSTVCLDCSCHRQSVLRMSRSDVCLLQCNSITVLEEGRGHKPHRCIANLCTFVFYVFITAQLVSGSKVLPSKVFRDVTSLKLKNAAVLLH